MTKMEHREPESFEGTSEPPAPEPKTYMTVSLSETLECHECQGTGRQLKPRNAVIE